MANRRIRLTKRPTNRLSAAAERFAGAITLFTGSTTAFVVALSVILVWALTGPLFGYSDTWQLVINTGTTIVTFLMVFLIQRTQNKDALAMQLKLNEIVAALEGASNRLHQRRGPDRGRAADAQRALRTPRQDGEAGTQNRRVALDRRGDRPARAEETTTQIGGGVGRQSSWWRRWPSWWCRRWPRPPSTTPPPNQNGLQNGS